jgi:hypothetical protein
MNKTHATLIALILGVAAVLGLFAAIRTAHLGAAARTATNASIVAQQRQLSAAEAALQRALAKTPVAAHRASTRTVYVRPAPIIVHVHRHGGDDGGEGSDDG